MVCEKAYKRRPMPDIGIKVKDVITGFEGIVTARCTYITGCDQFLVQPETKDGAFVESRWFDDNRLVAEEGQEPLVLDDEKKNGPCGMAPRK